MPLRLIPVLDVQDGLAVRAVAGDRARYRPLRSLLHPDPDPVGIARAYRECHGLDTLYLADLDAIAGGPANLPLYEAVAAPGLDLWVDAGIRDLASFEALAASTVVTTFIVGLETVAGPDTLAAIVARHGPGRLVFSLDLRDGIPLVAPDSGWGTADPSEIAGGVVGLGIRHLLLLDLARVGTGRGLGTLGLVERLARAHPGVAVAVGGGLAGPEDFAPFVAAGASSVLVGSAFHDGRIDVAGPSPP